MAGRLQGKVALVTAAGQGIGRASAVAMAAEGANVIATDVDPQLLESLPKLDGLKSAKLDVLDDAAIASLIGSMPKLDVLFNCAGWVHQGTILDCTDRDWDLSFNLNVRAMWKTIAAALPKMLAGGGGSIINMASVCSSVKGLPNRFAYGASKAAVIGLTKSVAADFVGRAIRCNCICPGTVDTPSLQQRIDAMPDPVQARAAFVARQPMGRLATAEEIAPIIVYLASDESRFATGNAFHVDGGMTI
ncbi:MAG TPA: SDR family oxidoreductase [Burkholderiaceae bacterium]|jgi:2-keto-3-deoxy-L-fuconate dehydrogenase|nr:SDR family oxidoreductase [Burkholderiaceae bacterium]